MPTWSNDGKWLYFSSDRTGPLELWKVPAAGGPAIQLTNERGFEGVEAPDGRSIYYSLQKQRSGLWKLDLETGETAPVPELATAGYHRYWASSKRGLYFLTGEAEPRPNQVSIVKRFDYETGEVTEVARFEGELLNSGSGMSVSADESELLLTTVEVDDKDLLLVDGFR